MTEGEEQAELPPISLPDGLQIQLNGFEEQLSITVGNEIALRMREVSRYLPLYNLIGLTVSYDYHAALTSIDRGLDAHIPMTASSDDELGEGVAMAIPVLRGGIVKTHIVLGPHVVGLIASDDEADNRRGYKLVIHELAHAADHEFKQQALGSAMLQPSEQLIPDAKERYLWTLSHCIWDEYYANRVSAPFDDEAEPYEDELFSTSFLAFKERLREARRDYHWGHMSLDDFLGVLAHNLRFVFISAGYLFGLYDAKEAQMTDIAPRSAPLLAEPEGRMILRFHDILLSLWERRGEWESYDEFLALNRPAEAMFNDLDCYLYTTDDDRVYIEIPARVEHVT